MNEISLTSFESILILILFILLFFIIFLLLDNRSRSQITLQLAKSNSERLAQIEEREQRNSLSKTQNKKSATTEEVSFNDFYERLSPTSDNKLSKEITDGFHSFGHNENIGYLNKYCVTVSSMDLVNCAKVDERLGII